MSEQYLNSRAYYNKSTGEILCFTNESFNREGLTIPTLQDDKENYQVLTTISDDILGVIELEFGGLFDILTKSKSYKVNNKQAKPALEVEYYTDDEIEARNIIEVVNLEQQSISDKITNIVEYTQIQDETTLTKIEDFILEIELNKIMEGMN